MAADPGWRFHIDRIGENYLINEFFPNQKFELTSAEVREIKKREGDFTFEELARDLLRKKRKEYFS